MSHYAIIKSEATSLSRYLYEINKIPSLSAEEEVKLANNYINENNITAAQQLVKSYLKLVAKVAMQYKNYGLSLLDLISEGNLGLMQAVKKFQPAMGFRLSTYAMFWIKAFIQEYILKSWSLVKIGTTSAQKKLFFSLNKMKNAIMNTEQREIQYDDYNTIAKELNINVEDVKEMDSRIYNRYTSLNTSIDQDNSNLELVDCLPSNNPSQEELLVASQDLQLKRQLMTNALQKLEAREKDILIARKLHLPKKTLKELSTQYNISEERVRQIEERAFQKLKNNIQLSINSTPALSSIKLSA